MTVGVPKEIKDQEFRVAMLPSGVGPLTRRGHRVLVEAGAGEGVGYGDDDFRAAGAEIVTGHEEAFSADLVVKVKEPLAREVSLLRPGQILFTFLHLAANRELTEGLLASRATCIAYETVEVNHNLPLLEPMSEIAGRMSVLVGGYLLAKHNEAGILELLPSVDLLIGAVLVPGARAPRLITRKMLRLMKPGSVFVDIAIDQGGCAETSRPTTHHDPTFVEEGVTHYCVANMPGAYARTATQALTNVTHRYAEALADFGFPDAITRFPELASGVNVFNGAITCPAVAKAHEPPLSTFPQAMARACPENSLQS